MRIIWEAGVCFFTHDGEGFGMTKTGEEMSIIREERFFTRNDAKAVIDKRGIHTRAVVDSAT